MFFIIGIKGGVLAEGMVSGEYVFCPMHD